MQEWQFRNNSGVASLHVNVVSAAVPFIVMIAVGRFVGRQVARKRAPAKIAELATGYEISEEALLSTAQMVEKL